MINEIRKKAVTDEIDYGFLINCLSDYGNPRDKITRLIKSGAIIRVKKGIYVFGKDYAISSYSKECLANLIYGPSYVSLEYALYFYGLIPERVEVVTSVTSKRNKFFTTPVGNFSYRHIAIEKYPVGIELRQIAEHKNILIASKEKALADKIYDNKDIVSEKDLVDYLQNDLRFEMDALKSFRTTLLEEILKSYNSCPIKLLRDLVGGEI